MKHNLKFDLKFCQLLSTRSLTSTQLSQDNSTFCSTDILKMQILITQKYPNSGLKVKATSLATAVIVTGDDVPLTSLSGNGIFWSCLYMYLYICCYKTRCDILQFANNFYRLKLCNFRKLSQQDKWVL